MTICVYIGMDLAYDTNKRLINLDSHGVDFTVFPDLWAGLVFHERDWRQTDERRWLAYGLLQGRLHIAAYTRRRGQFRVISIRKANSREKKYVKKESSKRFPRRRA